MKNRLVEVPAKNGLICKLRNFGYSMASDEFLLVGKGGGIFVIKGYLDNRKVRLNSKRKRKTK